MAALHTPRKLTITVKMLYDRETSHTLFPLWMEMFR